MKTTVKEPPPGCQEIPGYILEMFDRSVWLTQDLKVTDQWSERGVWLTLEAAEDAWRRVLEGKP